MQQTRQGTWLGELTGGIASALVAFSIAVPVGTLMVAPLGASHAGVGVLAGLAGTVLGGLVASAFGSTRVLRTGPMTAVALVVNSLLAFLLSLPVMQSGSAPDVTRVLAFGFLCVVLAGVAELALGLMRVGDAIKYVPRPVVTGFRNALALLIVVSQLPALLGTSVGGSGLRAMLHDFVPSSLAVGLATVLCAYAMRRIGLRGLSLFVALVFGALLDAFLAATYAGLALGPKVGGLPSLHAMAAVAPASHGFAQYLAAPGALGWVLTPALSLALVASLLSLLALRAAEDLTGERVNGNRELLAQGLANVAAGLAGGTPVSGSPATTFAAYHAGGRTRWTALVCSLLLAGFAATGERWIAMLPMAALAGVMVVIALDLVDTELLRLMSGLRARGHERDESLLDLGIVAAVLIASLAVNIVAGIVLGLLISAAMFAVKSSRRIVRRLSTGRERRSLRQRPLAQSRRLAERGHEIVLLELEGPVFFGTADRLSAEIRGHAGQARYVILDFRRVNAVDATGAHVIAHTGERLAAAGQQLVLASLPPDDPRRATLVRANQHPGVQWMPDADRALEWCEDRVLAEAGGDAVAAGAVELPLADMELCRELVPQEVARLAQALRREAYAAGTVLFRENDPGDCLYLLARGSVTIVLGDLEGAAGDQRIATFVPGVSFGELALLQGQPRSAHARFDTDAVVYALSRPALATLGETDPGTVIKIYRALSIVLSERLRTTTRELRLLAEQ